MSQTNTARKIDPFADEQPSQEQEVNSLVVQARALTIQNADDLAKGREFILAVKEMRKKIEDHHRPIIDAAFRAHKVAMGKMKELLEPLDAAERIVRNASDHYLTEQERLRREEQRKREEEARLEVERVTQAAREKLSAMTTAAKDDAERIATMRAALDNPNTTDIEAAVIRADVSVLEASAENRAQVAEQARAEMETMIAVPEPVPAVGTERTEGVGSVKEYAVEVVDVRLLCAAIGRGEVPPGCVDFKKSVLKTLAKAGTRLPGCRVTEKRAARIRG
jgi:hypothetical protein